MTATRNFLRATAIASAVGLVTLTLCACAPTQAETAAAKQATTERTWDDLDKQPIWIGRVTGYEGMIDDLVVVDYGGQYPVKVDLARIVPIDSCDDSLDDDYDEQYTAAIHKAAPVGATIAVVRSQEPDGSFGYGDDAFLHPVTPQRKADLTSKSLNEKMVEAGIAQPDPAVTVHPESYEDTVAQTITAERAQLSALDFTYWKKFVGDFVAADKKRIGPVGQCADYVDRENLKAAAEKRKSDRDYRRWRRGPDGRLGTIDDFSDGDDHAGSGSSGAGGSYNIPGGLCPTRFC